MSPLQACSIVSNNYLAYARVLTRSFLAHHPGGTLHLLVVDRPEAGHPYEREPFSVTFVEDLAIPGLLPLAFRSTLLELNTAVKPFFLQHLHRRLGCPSLLYFDPDILITGPLDGLYRRLDEADALLTPHLTAPLEGEGIPSERDILVSGAYNLGFLGLAFKPRTLAFLDWWGRRLVIDGRSAIAEGLFVDQRWMDFAPSFLPGAEILRDPGCNAAYWNLAQRRFERTPAGWRVEGSPLSFFHFSGVDPERPELLSRFQNRFTLAGRPDVAPLFAHYHQRLAEEGHAELRGYPYSFGRFSNGAGIPGVARRAYRLLDPRAERWPDPFASEGHGTFFSFLAAPAAAEGLPLPRLALLTWDERPDLQARFPDPVGRDREGFARWYLRRGEGGGPPEGAFTRALEPALVALDLPRGADAPERRALEALVRAEGPPSLLDPGALRWLLADAGHEGGARPLLPRLALELHRRRNDLAASFPDPLGRDRRRLALWFVTSGRREYLLPKEVIAPVLRTLAPRDRIWAALWGWRRSRFGDGPRRPPARAGGGSGALP